jgi:hypothetical protein
MPRVARRQPRKFARSTLPSDTVPRRLLHDLYPHPDGTRSLPQFPRGIIVKPDTVTARQTEIVHSPFT